MNDVVFALRAVRRAPGFTAVVCISIALGIAANTTVFSMVNATLLGALTVRDPRGLYSISSGRTFPYPDYRDFRDQCATLFDGLAGHFPLAPASLATGAGTPERVWGALVTGNYFAVVGPPLAAGRGIGPEHDEVEGRDPVVVLGDSLWRRRFGTDPAAVGQTAVFNGRRYTIIGVMAPGFHGSDRGIVTEFWAPLAMRRDFVPDLVKDAEKRTAYWIGVSGRLKPGVTRVQAVAALNVVHTRINQTYRKNDRRDSLTLDKAGRIPGERQGVAGLMAILMVVVALVLLIACANVANLMLARAVDRQREIGIRLAVGAGRARLVSQLLTESVILAALGAVGGFALAYAAARALSRFQLPLPIPFALDFTPDLRVLAFTAAVTVAAGVLFGIAPAIMASRTDLVSALKGTAGLGIFYRFGLRNLLVGVQVTLSSVLLIAAGLFVRSLASAASMDLGIRPEGVLMMAVDPKTAGYSNERLREFLRQAEERLTALPGVRSAAAVNILPLSMAQSGENFRDADAGEKADSTEANVFATTAAFFQTVGMPLLRGRTFRPQTDLDAPVALVNRTMARRLFGNREPLGRRIRDGKGKTYEIIGVTGDSKSVTLGEEVRACAYTYLPRDAAEQVLSLLGMTFLVKTGGDPAAMVRPVRDEILKLDTTLAVFNVDSLGRHISRAFLVPRLCAVLFGVFGLIGLVLAAVGLFGVVSYSVRSRTREIGIRVALGATPGAILRLVLTQGLAIVALGLALGLAIAAAVSRFTASLLYGVSPTDLLTFAAVPVVLLLTAVAAVVVPARRACAIRPMDALRLE
jgi:predicted permease